MWLCLFIKIVPRMLRVPFPELGRSTNPAAIACHKYRRRHAFDAVNQRQQEVRYAFTRKSNRGRGKLFLDLFHNPGPNRGEPWQIRVCCNHCRWETVDDMPCSNIATDKYIIRTFKWYKCPVDEKKGKKARAKQRLFVPLDVEWKAKSIPRSKIDNDRTKDYRRNRKNQKRRTNRGENMKEGKQGQSSFSSMERFSRMTSSKSREPRRFLSSSLATFCTVP